MGEERRFRMDSRFKVICRCITGSHLYGTATPDSDLDIRGVIIPTEEFYLGYLEKVEQVESHKPDETFWEITKFFQLCLDNNPNILELLFIPIYSDYTEAFTSEWEEIVAHRYLFLSTKAKHTFSGYAVSQLHRIKQHREWLLHPPSHKPTRQEFDLPDTNTITKDQIGAYDELLAHGETIELSVPGLEVLRKEKAFINANTYWGKYQEWATNRNKDRAVLEAHYGYDTKHASHLIRLINEGKELLTKGIITFPRPDAELLRDIRNGKYTYDELMNMLGEDVDSNFNGIESILPHTPNRKDADILCRKLVKSRLGYGNASLA
jgi:hypothetical protein